MEKLIAISDLFEISLDELVKGEKPETIDTTEQIMRGIALTGSRGGTGEKEKGKDNPSYIISVDGHQD